MNPDVVCARPDTTAGDLARLLAERRAGGAPVVDGSGRVLGAISLDDLVRHESREITVAEAGQFHTDDEDYRELASTRADLKDTLVEKLMHQRVYTVARDAGVAVAANIMRERRVHRLYVTDGGRLVGVISALDLMRVVEEAC